MLKSEMYTTNLYSYIKYICMKKVFILYTLFLYIILIKTQFTNLTLNFNEV